MGNQPPCTAWAEKLALRHEDLSPADRTALESHVKTCPACEAAQADYHYLDARLRALPLPTLQPLPRLTPQFTTRDKGEEEVGMAKAAGFGQTTPRSSTIRRPAIHRSPFASSIRKSLPGLSIAALVLALLLLFGSRTINTAIGRPLGTPLLTYQGHSDFVDAVAWSPDGRFIASGSWDHTVRIWNAKIHGLVLSYQMGDIVDAVAWSPDSRYIASGSWDHTVQVWDVYTGTLLRVYTGQDHEVSSLAWSPDGNYIASGSWDHTLRVWNVHTGALLFSYQDTVYNEFVDAVAWSPNGRYIAVGWRDSSIDVLDAKTGSITMHYQMHTNDADVVNTLAWSPDSRFIASGGRAHDVEVWNASTAKLLLTYQGHTNEVTAVAWSPDGRYIASGSWDHTVQVWNARTGLPLVIYRGHSDNVDAVAWSPDGRLIASGSWDDTVQVWQAGEDG